MTDKNEKTPALAPGSHDGAASPPPTFDGDLTDLGTLKRLLARHGISLNKGLGQHLLTSRKALSAVVGAADLTPDDRVLEVGAGPGVLTRELAQRARRVVAVEGIPRHCQSAAGAPYRSGQYARESAPAAA